MPVSERAGFVIHRGLPAYSPEGLLGEGDRDGRVAVVEDGADRAV